MVQWERCSNSFLLCGESVLCEAAGDFCSVKIMDAKEMTPFGHVIKLSSSDTFKGTS